jgi:tripartite-type tricarboxylate transporter receptor subunit TctC
MKAHAPLLTIGAGPSASRLRLIVILFAGFSLIAPAAAQTYPDRVIRVIVPFAAGGPADTLARLVMQRLSILVGQNIVIDNRPGAGGTIGAKAVVAAEPDGYTLMYGNTSTLAVGPAVYKNVGYDSLRQFAPIALISITHNVLVVDPALPVRSLPQLVAHAKANPGKINFSSPGHGTPPHMVGELFKSRAGIDIVHVPYRGSAAALADIMTGQTQIAFENPSVVVPLVQAGRLRGLAVTGETRNAQVPDLPTMMESGIDVVSMSFTGILAPAGTPADIVRKLNAAINDALSSAELRESFAKLGVETRVGSSADFAAFIAREKDKWAAVAKSAGIQIN